MINPDGVSRGYYRVDTKGQNLNRFYTDPKPDIHPTIYAIKKAVEQQHELGKLKVIKLTLYHRVYKFVLGLHRFSCTCRKKRMLHVWQ